MIQEHSLYEQAGLYLFGKTEVNKDIIKKEGSPTLDKSENEACKNKKINMKKSRVARPWQKFKKWVIKQKKVKIKKPGQPSLGNSYNHLLSTMMTIMTGSAIKSTVTGGEVSLSQRSLVSHVGQRLKHHVHSKQKGWVSQGAKTKPMVLVQARVDQPAYMALQITPHLV